MKLLFSRHGNTFDAATPATWVGCKNDLPLVDAGIAQAQLFARMFKQSGAPLNAIYCGPLKRTQEYAKIIVQGLKADLAITIDPRLNELDYGDWAGLTNQQICEKFGADVLERWEKNCEWPSHGWGSTEKNVRLDALSFANDLIKKHAKDDTVLIISSNGKLRYFLALMQDEFERRMQTDSLKVKTGNICRMEYENEWRLAYWNKAPEAELFL